MWRSVWEDEGGRGGGGGGGEVMLEYTNTFPSLPPLLTALLQCQCPAGERDTPCGSPSELP